MDLITEANLNNSWLETMTVEEFSYHKQGFNSIQTDVNNWRKQRLSYGRLSNGIQIKVLNYLNYKDYGKIIEHDENKPLISHFLLSGDHNVFCPGIINNQAEYTEKSGQNYLAFLPSIEEVEKAYQGEDNQIIIINLPVNFFREFISELKEIPQDLKPLMENNPAPRFHRQIGTITPMMRTVIKQILEHPYQGIIARMYLEAKVLELISLQLFQLIQQENQQPRCLKLSTQEIEQIYEAQGILKTNYLQPPSIVELAQKVGLDRMKLQQGFRELFQVTPFQYLQNYRLDLARILLEKKDLTVSNVAHRIGYSNVSYFSRAFKRRFGVTPGKYSA